MRLRLIVLAVGTFAMGVDTFVIAPILGRWPTTSTCPEPRRGG